MKSAQLRRPVSVIEGTYSLALLKPPQPSWLLGMTLLQRPSTEHATMNFVRKFRFPGHPYRVLPPLTHLHFKTELGLTLKFLGHCYAWKINRLTSTSKSSHAIFILKQRNPSAYWKKHISFNKAIRIGRTRNSLHISFTACFLSNTSVALKLEPVQFLPNHQPHLPVRLTGYFELLSINVKQNVFQAIHVWFLNIHLLEVGHSFICLSFSLNWFPSSHYLSP